MTISHHAAPLRDLDPRLLYALMRLRVDVFVVEQDCPYPELDGRDLEDDTVHYWSADESGAVLATIRLLHDGDDRRIGRVATAVDARGQGLAGILIRKALESSAGHAVHLDAQAHLEGWYARFGFVKSGEGFLEDGIPHVPMTLTAS